MHPTQSASAFFTTHRSRLHAAHSGKIAVVNAPGRPHSAPSMASPNYKGNNPRPGPHRGPSGPPRPATGGPPRPATGAAGSTSSGPPRPYTGGPPRPAGTTGPATGATGAPGGTGSPAPRPYSGPSRPGGSFGNGKGRGGSRGRGRGGYSAPQRRPEPVEDDSKQKEEAIELEGTISAVLAGTMFRVKLKNEHEVLAHISGKMRKKFIRLVIGDNVKIEMSPYDMDKARIVYRL